MESCIFCKSEKLRIEKDAFYCDNCKRIFPDLRRNYSIEFFENFIDSYLNFIPKIFPYIVAIEMKKYFDTDLKRIFHAINVANYAKFICDNENAQLDIVLCCGYLHDIGIKNAELKYNNNAPKYQEIEGPPVAKEILSKLNCSIDLIEEVCDIIGHHHSPKENESKNFMCLYDADLIVNWIDGVKEREVNPGNRDKLFHIFLTDTGKNLFNTISNKILKTKNV